MVELGQRNLDLNKVPRLADVLKLDRGDLCKLALFEAAPVLYSALFGSDAPGEVRLADGKLDESVPTPTRNINDMMMTLPVPIRDALLGLVETLGSSLNPPYRRR